jgi:dipeptidyl aminopeptidase/acylaminoacyl peptidase
VKQRKDATGFALSVAGAVLACSVAGAAPAKRGMTPRDVVSLVNLGGPTGRALAVSSGGRFAAVETHRADVDANTYRVRWTVVPLDGSGEVQDVGDGGDALLFRRIDDDGTVNGSWVSEAPVWLPDDQWLAYRRSARGEVQIWRSRRDGAVQEQLTRNRSDVEAFVLSVDGTRLLFAVDADRASKSAASAAAARQGFLFVPDKPFAVLDARPYEQRYALLEGSPRIWAYELQRRLERPAAPEEEKEFHLLAGGSALEPKEPLDARAVAVAPDGRGRAWLAPAFADRQGARPPLALHFLDPGRARARTRCMLPECTGMFRDVGAGELWWRADGAEVFFVRADGPNYGRRTWHAWNVARDEVRLVLKEHWAQYSSCSPTRDRLICLMETPIHPRVVVSVDLVSGRIRTLWNPNPQFADLSVGEVERIEWSDTKNRSTHGLLVKPLGHEKGRRFPLIIVGYRAAALIHGGTGAEYPAHVFAANGMGTLLYDTPDPWDVFATVSDPREELIRMWSDDVPELTVPFALLESAVTLLDQRGLIDPNKVGITGFSTGMSQATYALIHSNRYAAAAISSPPWAPGSHALTQSGEFGRRLFAAIGLGAAGTDEGRLWPELALTLNVGRVNAPLLVNAADSEYVIGRDTVVTFAEAAKPIVEMHVYPDENHVKWYPAHRLSVYERNTDWFNFWLLGREDPAAHKAAQYARWRSMKEALGKPAAGSLN